MIKHFHIINDVYEIKKKYKKMQSYGSLENMYSFQVC